MIQATGLSNSIIGGKNSAQNAIRFQAQHSSPVAAFRCYVIDNAAGYSGGTGGFLRAELYEDRNGQPFGPALAFGMRWADPEFPDPLSGRGRFPLVCLPQDLIKGNWYWIIISNIDPVPVTNYFSMDYLTGPPNQVPTASVYLRDGIGPWKLVDYLIPSPFVIHYANGLYQGLGWIGVQNGALEGGEEYGFPAGSCQ